LLGLAETCSRISTIKIQSQDSCVFRQSPPPSFDIYKHNGADEPEGIYNLISVFMCILINKR
jgi:hypothetical protein